MARKDRVARRENPSLILPGVQSVIMVGMLYWPGATGFPPTHQVATPRRGNHKALAERSNPTSSTDSATKTTGIVSSYAWGDDYHTILSKRLKALARHLNERAGGLGRFYVDTGAILERDFASRAGLGFIGKNSLLINPEVGSGFFIGEIFTTIPLPHAHVESKAPQVAKRKGRPGCGACVKCITACPTDAIVQPFVVDARRCISYLTIELRGSIPYHLRKGMGGRVYGCDICQVVCPWNRRNVWKEGDEVVDGAAAFSPLFGRVLDDISTPVLSDWLLLSEQGFQKRFARSAVRRIGRVRLARNCAVALGNLASSDADLRALLSASLNDASPLVREHAKWALREVRRRRSDGTGSKKGTSCWVGV